MIVRLVWLHAAILLAASILVTRPDPVGFIGSISIGLLGIAANQPRGGQRIRGSLASVGLLSASAIMVHLSGGYIEMHFHFFVALAIIAFYQEWVVFLVAIAFVLLEHGVIGVLFPTAVYNHHAAQVNPWLWAGIHAAFVAGASVANLFGWRVTEQQSLHDPLTRLPNRALFRDRADHALLRTRRHTFQIAVMFVDLDRFKPINDTWGHHVGDTVLLEVAERLTSNIRAGDTVARLGGDEFAVLLEEVDDPGEAAHIARRIQESLRIPIMIQGRPIPIRASVGIALSADAGVSVDELISDADLAMYSAKKRGGGRCVVYEASMRVGVAERLDLEMELRRAVSLRQFEVYYQPAVDLTAGKVVGVEALLRWNHRSRGSISPTTFIPLAEETGLIVPLGLWVLEQACRQSVSWNRQTFGRAPIAVSVNVSALQLTRDTFVQDVERILRETGVQPSTITLELTESALMDDVETTTSALKQLKDLGVRLAIDDFGTGYSSLSYLQRLPIDVLKIDRSFVDRIQHGAEELAFARAIVDLARTLSLSTVAEGIELESQADRLTELGCNLGQGFLYSRPVPAEEIDRLLGMAAEQTLAS
ncbi:MAG: putative bifunctional diguanylate cyclase/phosphodiesterase [Chloroflexota bacterium]